MADQKLEDKLHSTLIPEDIGQVKKYLHGIPKCEGHRNYPRGLLEDRGQVTKCPKGILENGGTVTGRKKFILTA